MAIKDVVVVLRYLSRRLVKTSMNFRMQSSACRRGRRREESLSQHFLRKRRKEHKESVRCEGSFVWRA